MFGWSQFLLRLSKCLVQKLLPNNDVVVYETFGACHIRQVSA